MPTVRVEGVGTIQFPDDMSPEQISHAIETEIIPQGSKSRREGREARGGTQGALAVLNGLSMGFGDELAGSVKGLISALSGGRFGEGYESGRDYVRGAVEQYRKDQPVLGPIADISGGLLTAPLAVVGAAGKMGALGRGMMAAGTGATTGAIQGAGEAESMGEVPGKALAGGVLGGALGAAGTGAGAAMGAVRDQVMPRFSGSSAYELAMRRVGNSIVRDEKTGQIVSRRMDKLGDEATIADAAGENARNLLDTVATLPGKTQDKVERLIRQRQVGRADRLDAIPDSLSGGHRADDVFQALQAERERAAGPLYRKVDATAVPLTGNLLELSERPVVKQAMEQARINARNEGREFVEFINDGALNQGQMPLRFWDDVKKGLDDVISGIKRNGPSSNAAGSTLHSAVRVKNELLTELDKLAIDPKTGRSIYKDARDAFAGPAALQSAIEDGRGALSMSPLEIGRATFRMSKSEAEAFRLGAAEAYREKIGSRGGQTALLNAWADRNTRQQMKAIFGEEHNYRVAMSTLLAESELKKLERVGRGSQTAGREARIEDMNTGVLDDAATVAKSAAGGNVLGLVSAARSLGGRLGTPEVVRDEIGRILTQRGVPAKDQLQAMEQIIRSMQMGNSQAAAIQGVLGGSLMNP